MKITLNKNFSRKAKAPLIRDNPLKVKAVKRSTKRVMMNMKAQANKKGELSDKSLASTKLLLP
jgi:hypothetical protein